MSSLVLLMVLFSADTKHKDFIIEDRVDVIEICHLHDPIRNNAFRMDEIIFWKWQQNDNKEWGHHIVDWRQIFDGRKKYAEEKLGLQPEAQIAFEIAESKKPEYLQLKWERPWVGSALVPVKHGKYWICEFFEDGYHRKIIATSYRETWMIDDPEVDDRMFLAKKHRSYLTRLPSFMKDESAFFAKEENKKLLGIKPYRD